MRCPDCNKFAAFDDPECETASVDLTETSISIDCRVFLKCADCGQELKESQFNSSVEVEHGCEGAEFEIVNEGEPEPSDRHETKDRNGKPIKSARYQKRMIGFTQEVTVKCLKCQEQLSIIISDECAASSFDELV